jgi:hypothetical protein
VGPREPYHCDLLPSPYRLARNVLNHAAGLTPDGAWIVVDVWESQKAFDGFLASRLAGVRQVGGMPQQDGTPFEVYNTFHHGQ